MLKLNKTRSIALLGMFAAIIFLMTFTGVGIIPLPFVRPTTLHIPVIIGALLLGPKYGAALGFIFGLASMMFATFNPGPTSFVFSPFIQMPGTESGSASALLVAFVPRILVGVIPWYVYIGLRKLTKDKFNLAALAITGVAGSLTNTLLVMHLIFLLFGESWNAARATPADAIYAAILGIIAVNGIPEAIASGVLVAAVMGVLSVVTRQSKALA